MLKAVLAWCSGEWDASSTASNTPSYNQTSVQNISHEGFNSGITKSCSEVFVWVLCFCGLWEGCFCNIEIQQITPGLTLTILFCCFTEGRVSLHISLIRPLFIHPVQNSFVSSSLMNQRSQLSSICKCGANWRLSLSQCISLNSCTDTYMCIYRYITSYIIL